MSSNAMFTAKATRNMCRLFTWRWQFETKIVRETNFSLLALQGKLTVLSLRSKIVLKAKICEKFLALIMKIVILLLWFVDMSMRDFLKV